MSLDELIGAHVNYEEELLLLRHDEDIWLQYADAVAGNPAQSAFVLERAVCALPASALLWNAYLLLPGKSTTERIELYRRALLILSETPAYWFKLINLLQLEMSQDANAGIVAQVLQALDMALMNLHSSQHPRIWEIYFDVVEKLQDLAEKDHGLGEKYRSFFIAFYRRLFEALSLSLAKIPVTQSFCVLKIAELRDYAAADSLFRKLPVKKDLEFLHEYLKILLNDIDFSDNAYFEKIALGAIHDYPKSQYRVLFWLANYYSDRQNPEKARYFFSLSLKTAANVHEVTEAFDRYTNWEENQLERSVQGSTERQEIELQLSRFETILDRHKLYLSDVLIREDPNCVDHWLDRITVFADKNQPSDRILTYVQAIRTINPLQSHSSRGNTLARLWSDYAEIYVNSGDTKSAEIIFARAVKSPCKTIQELADLYIKWTELKLAVSDEAALKHVEEVLFLDKEPESDEKGSRHRETETRNLEALSQSVELWDFYLDLLQAVLAGFDRLDTAYKRMMTLQIITLRMLFDYATFLRNEKQVSRQYKVYEAGLSQFHSSEAQAIIWGKYLQSYVQDESTEAVHDLFSRCLRQKLPNYCAGKIYLQCAQFCSTHGSTFQASKVLQSGIDYVSKADASHKYRPEQRKSVSADKAHLYATLISHLEKINDDSMLRDAYASALEDLQLFLADTVDFGSQFIQFEKAKNEPVRVRYLYKHLVTLGHPSSPLLKKVWDDWEAFEAENGDENSFKDVLREKRMQLKRLEEIAEIKADINPIGFIKGETRTEKATDTTKPETINPDAIELDMDDM